MDKFFDDFGDFGQFTYGFDKTHEPSFRKRPERSSIPAALRTFVLLKIFSMSISVVYAK